MERHERLRHARIQAGIKSAAEAARRLHVPIGTYGGHEAGTRGIRADESERYAKAFNVTAAWLTYGDGEGPPNSGVLRATEAPDTFKAVGEVTEPNVRPAPDLPSLGSLRPGPRNIPMLGIAVGGDDDDGDFHLNGETVDFVARPPGLANAKDVYALATSNDSMYPRFEPGDVFFINPHRVPNIGDDVVVELYAKADGDPAGPAFLKRLKARTPTKFIVEQFNPPREIEFARERVKAIHRVVPWREALGI